MRQVFGHAWGVVLLAMVLAGCGHPDAGIQTAVRANLAADTSVPADEITVEAEHGVVRLTGTVETQVARRRALEIARETRGVRDVVDELQIVPGAEATTGDGGLNQAERGIRTTDPQWREGEDAVARAADAAVGTSVRTALQADTSLAELNILVSASNGVVTLTGRVPSQTEKHRAIELARETEGVRSVVDRLEIK